MSWEPIETAPKDGMAEHRPMFGESGYARAALDFYETPAWCVDVLLRRMRPRDVVWEPACGKGAILDALRAAGVNCFGSDIADYGISAKQFDFLTVPFCDDFDIITNPPYDKAEAFIRKALELTKPHGGKVAMLLRNEYDCAATRVDLFDREPFALKLVLTKRPRWSTSDKASPRHNFAWFIWDWTHQGRAIIAHQSTVSPRSPARIPEGERG